MVTIAEIDISCLQGLQEFHKNLDHEKGFDTDIIRNVAYLTGEIGEVMTAIRELKKANSPEDISTAREGLGEELVDCLAYVLKLANYAEVNLGEAYLAKMENNLSRDWRKLDTESSGD